jgi:hypothetical protein
MSAALKRAAPAAAAACNCTMERKYRENYISNQSLLSNASTTLMIGAHALLLLLGGVIQDVSHCAVTQHAAACRTANIAAAVCSAQHNNLRSTLS